MKRSILVTGGCGFIGSHFINHIFEQENFDYKYEMVVNLDALYYCANQKNISDKVKSSDKYSFVEGNLNNKLLVDEILRKYKINYVIHFAAQSHVDLSFSIPLQYTQDNVQGTHTLLECLREYIEEGHEVDKIVHVSTDEVYGESMLDESEQCKTEQSILCPTNPYAASKAAAELIAQSYIHSFKLPIIITRSNNVYGEGQYPEKLIPRFIQLLKEENKLTVHGKGESKRAFIYVRDVISALEMIIDKGEISEIYNIGCDENMEYTVLEIAKMLILKFKGPDDENFEKWIEYVKDRPFNDKRYYISNAKMKSLGWKINVRLPEWISKYPNCL